ncbi:NAD-dependent epimerase/dehydratase family protein [Thalassotalea sp. HSM 43]|uniref:NAD(P)H-binding protein n=1 Tax=Thalassotalea sp. HSM 43 TaxID=2552945 RepID=UPI0010819D43|nr:NAD(P)H-binding protein [Thalassotalea sp. HSM 43]QBY05734.1 NAD-dependent epimerase/dehydratase family protein [Thalassotalea sp. HSM 43]
MKTVTAALFGASGLTGSALLTKLLNSTQFSQVTVFVRKKLNVSDAKLIQVVVDFDQIENLAEHLRGIDTVFCCLGTTIKKAKTKQAFAAIDYQLVLDIGKQCAHAQVKHFMVISSLGANSESKAFYNATKGRMECDIARLGLTRISVVRPSLLIGQRPEFRLAEQLSIVITSMLGFVFIGPLAKLKPIKVSSVANAMFQIAVRDQYNGTDTGKNNHIEFIENDTLHRLADAAKE